MMKNQYAKLIVVFVLSLIFSGAIFIKKSKIGYNQSTIINTTNGLFLDSTLQVTVESMLRHDDKLYKFIQDSCRRQKALFYMFSEKECGTCVDGVLTEVYGLAQKYSDSKIIIITPGFSPKKNQILSRRYDNLLTFVPIKGNAWEEHLSGLKNYHSLFFIFTSKLSVTRVFKYNRHNLKANKSYFSNYFTPNLVSYDFV